MTEAELVLEDGRSFKGTAFGGLRSVSGEVVFCTAMAGYVETLTDPSYRGQILVLTFPLVGNYGVPAPRAVGSLDAPYESSCIQVAGLVVTHAVARPSHSSSARTLARYLGDEGVPGMQGVDTRALTRHLRERGTMRGRLVVAGADAPEGVDMSSVGRLVAPREVTRHDAGPRSVLLVDAGAKDNLVRSLLRAGLSVVRAPFHADLLRLASEVDGVILGSGPGDPKDHGALVETTRALLAKDTKPVLGVCLGNQILALAAGGDTAKLPYGHRGVNQPVIDLTTRRAYVTSQNHGYAVVDSSLPEGFVPWFVNANDGTNEGIRSLTRPHRSVQFHPEARPGPTDTSHLFEDFAKLVHEATVT